MEFPSILLTDFKGSTILLVDHLDVNIYHLLYTLLTGRGPYNLQTFHFDLLGCFWHISSVPLRNDSHLYTLSTSLLIFWHQSYWLRQRSHKNETSRSLIRTATNSNTHPQKCEGGFGAHESVYLKLDWTGVWTCWWRTSHRLEFPTTKFDPRWGQSASLNINMVVCWVEWNDWYQPRLKFSFMPGFRWTTIPKQHFKNKPDRLFGVNSIITVSLQTRA